MLLFEVCTLSRGGAALISNSLKRINKPIKVIHVNNLSDLFTSLLTVTSGSKVAVLGSPYSPLVLILLILVLLITRRKSLYMISDSQLLRLLQYQRINKLESKYTQNYSIYKLISRIKIIRAFLLEDILSRLSILLFVGYLDYRFTRIRHPKSIYYFPNGYSIKPSPSSLVKPQMYHKSSMLKILFVGNLDYKPNMLACSQILKIAHNCPFAFFTIVGEGSHLFDAHSVPQNVNFVGRARSIKEYLESCDLFYAPMLVQTGIPNKILDASAFNLKILTTPLIKHCFNPASRAYLRNIIYARIEEHPSIIQSLYMCKLSGNAYGSSIDQEYNVYSHTKEIFSWHAFYDFINSILGRRTW